MRTRTLICYLTISQRIISTEAIWVIRDWWPSNIDISLYSCGFKVFPFLNGIVSRTPMFLTGEKAALLEPFQPSSLSSRSFLNSFLTLLGSRKHSWNRGRVISKHRDCFWLGEEAGLMEEAAFEIGRRRGWSLAFSCVGQGHVVRGSLYCRDLYDPGNGLHRPCQWGSNTWFVSFMVRKEPGSISGLLWNSLSHSLSSFFPTHYQGLPGVPLSA